MQQELVREHRRWTSGFGFGGRSGEQATAAQLSVICGRAATWQRPLGQDDDGFEPTIVRGRE